MGGIFFPNWMLFGLIYGGLLIPSTIGSALHWPFWALFPSVGITMVVFYYADQWLERRNRVK